ATPSPSGSATAPPFAKSWLHPCLTAEQINRVLHFSTAFRCPQSSGLYQIVAIFYRDTAGFKLLFAAPFQIHSLCFTTKNANHNLIRSNHFRAHQLSASVRSPICTAHLKSSAGQ